ncbi:hypothetical protein PI125_g20904 [Phytophthora idaei]|nr:hypothetical protein PI125_g20904 [Phytophthora idaei]
MPKFWVVVASFFAARGVNFETAAFPFILDSTVAPLRDWSEPLLSSTFATHERPR